MLKAKLSDIRDKQYFAKAKLSDTFSHCPLLPLHPLQLLSYRYFPSNTRMPNSSKVAGLSKVKQPKINSAYAVRTRATSSSFDSDPGIIQSTVTPFNFSPELLVDPALVDPINALMTHVPVVTTGPVPQHTPQLEPIIPELPLVVEPSPNPQPTMPNPAQLLSKNNTSITIVEITPSVPQPTQKSGKKYIDHEPKELPLSPSNPVYHKPEILPNGTSTPQR